MPPTMNCLKKFLIILLSLTSLPLLRAQDQSDLDNYKWRVEGNWWFSHPSGYFGVNKPNNSYFDINKDFGFGSYSTFSGRIDWHYAHKHHFVLSITPNYESKSATATRVITFQGQTFDVGAQVAAKVDALNIAPGYEYDIIRRDHGFLGLEVDFNLIRTYASLGLAGSVNGAGGSVFGSKTIWAPLPAAGPVFRWYPLHDSNRVSFDGSVRGMPFFGYGNFIAARGAVDIGLTPHLALRAGYQMGSRLSIHGTSDQIAVRLTHKGPTAGIEYSWGDTPPKKVHNPNPTPSDWHVDWVPFYLWFSGLSGNVGAAGQPPAPVSVSFSDVFKQLNIGMMTNMDVRRKRVGVYTDLIFMSLSSDQKTTPIGNTYIGFTANVKELILDPQLYVRVVEKERGSIDAIGGGRFWHLNNSLDLFPPNNQTTVTAGQTESWIDPVFGARGRLNLNKGLFLNLNGDVGGFGVGSQQTYQIYTGMGKEFKKKFSMLMGYRYMYVDYKNGGFLYNTHMSGLQAGFNIRFK
jgi:hypothetical protein